MTWNDVLTTVNTLLTPALIWAGFMLKTINDSVTIMDVRSKDTNKKVTELNDRLIRMEEWRAMHSNHDDERFEDVRRYTDRGDRR